jgi:short subunit dehydrogenase-like uncharacterized protein
MAELMIYGATGYTGRLACDYAKRIGIEFIIAGQTIQKLQSLASSLSLPYRAFGTEDSSEHIDSALKGIRVLLNYAGPFHRTARPLMEACIRNGVHYLDVAAELDSYKIAEELNGKAKDANTTLLPGCGGSVTILGCLAMHVVERIKSPVSIDIALQVAGSISRGSAITVQEGAITAATRHGSDGVAAVLQEAGSNKMFDFGDGRGGVECFPVQLPDLITISKATGVHSVQTFVHVAGASFPTGDLASLPDGPTIEERQANPYHAAVEITAEDGSIQRAVLHTVNGYTFTAVASIEGARQVLAGGSSPGFWTPVQLFGSKFVEDIEGSVISYHVI